MEPIVVQMKWVKETKRFVQYQDENHDSKVPTVYVRKPEVGKLPNRIVVYIEEED